MITRELLHNTFTYNSKGWLERKNDNKRAGTTDYQGYRRIKINGKSHREHRLVWMYHHGLIEKEQIDHINRDRQDNRIENLREVTNIENSQNRRIRKGYYKNKNGKYHVRIKVLDKNIHIGYYDDEVTALEEYVKAKKKYHPFAEIGDKNDSKV